MNADEVKTKLEGIKWLDEEIKELHLELQYLEQGLFEKSRLTPAKVQTSRVNSTESKIVHAIKLKQDIEVRLSEVISERLESSRLIDKTKNPLERAILRMFYVNHLEAWEISDRIERSKTTVYRIKKDGIENISKAMTTL